MLRQAQHERKIHNDFSTRPVRPEPVEGRMRVFSLHLKKDSYIIGCRRPGGGRPSLPAFCAPGSIPPAVATFGRCWLTPLGSLPPANAPSILAEGEHYEDHRQGNHLGLV